MSGTYLQRWLLCNLKRKLCEFAVAPIGKRPVRCQKSDKVDGKLIPTGDMDTCPRDKEATNGRS